MSSFACEHCGTFLLDTPIGYITGCEHYPLDPEPRRKLRIMRCEQASCRGGIEGCNGSECQKPRWDKMTRTEYREFAGLDAKANDT